MEFIGVVGLAWALRLGFTQTLLSHLFPDAEKFHIGTYGIGRNPHGSKYIPIGFLSNFIRPYPVTYLSILSDLI